MKKVTLGGERLGSGKKMEVELHGYERSTHDLGYVWRSTMAAGTLVPFMSEVALPGDTFDIRLHVDVKTHPTIGPLFGSYKIQLDVFQAPMRLYQSGLHNNKLGIGMQMSMIKLPQMQFISLPAEMEAGDEENLSTSQINPSCLLAYLGLRGIGINGTDAFKTRYFNGIPLLAYWEIYKNYYSNKQEGIGAVIHYEAVETEETVDEIEVTLGASTTILPQRPSVSGSQLIYDTTLTVKYTGLVPQAETIAIHIVNLGWVRLSDIGVARAPIAGEYIVDLNPEFTALAPVADQWDYQNNIVELPNKPQVTTFDLEAIDAMRENILATDAFTAFQIMDQNLEPYKWLAEASTDGRPNALGTQEGLGLKTYQSDLFNNWLDTENITAISTRSAVSTAGDSFTIDQIVLAKKVYDMLNRIAVSGGTYDDWLDVTYMNNRIQRSESPIYHGGAIRELVFQEVVSNNASEGQPLGTLAGKGVMGQKQKGGTVVINVDEPSYIMGIISLTPRVDYSQGNKWDMHLQTIDDLHKPAMDEIGFQDLVTEQMAWWDTDYDNGAATWRQKSAGKQPAWINYMTNVNRNYGNFAIASNEMFMTLNRRYEPDIQSADLVTIKDLTSYIDPEKFNFIFAETALDAQNFWTQIAVDITARRKMSAKIMPNL